MKSSLNLCNKEYIWLMGVLYWIIGAFWTVSSITLYDHKILSEPYDRSVWQIITNPEGAFNQPKRVKQHIYCSYDIKGQKYFPWHPF